MPPPSPSELSLNGTPLTRRLPVALLRAGEIGALFALTLFAPFVIHLLPVWGDENWGARLLPIFFGPLLASLYYRPMVGLAIALLAPWVNFLLTGRPLPPMALILCTQLFVYVVFLKTLSHHRGSRFSDAVVGYPVAVLGSACLIALAPNLHPLTPLAHWWTSVTGAWPGMILLGVVSHLAIRHYPPTAPA